MQIKIKKISPDAVMPAFATEGAACFDLTCVAAENLGGGLYKMHTGLAFEIPKGYVGLLYPRSSIYKTGAVLANSVGVIDSDYRGEVCAMFAVANTERWVAQPDFKGTRVAQMMIRKLDDIELVEAEELSATDRGVGGFGSTGR